VLDAVRLVLLTHVPTHVGTVTDAAALIARVRADDRKSRGSTAAAVLALIDGANLPVVRADAVRGERERLRAQVEALPWRERRSLVSRAEVLALLDGAS
jgi:hypothetical protein